MRRPLAKDDFIIYKLILQRGEIMAELSSKKENSFCKVRDLQGSGRFISRITSMGLTIGAEVEVLQNKRNNPLLLYVRDTMLAVSKKEAKKILVEEV